MTYDSYPPGMTHEDLVHVGEISNRELEDFISYYDPDIDQLSEWFEADPEGAIDTIKKFRGLELIQNAWISTHKEEIEEEWEDQQ